MHLTEEEWDAKWGDIFDRYQQDIRHAHYIRSVLRRSETRLLEIASGSFRDMAALNRWGICCDGFDFSEAAVRMARRAFPDIAQKIRRANAFETSVPDAGYDLTYHNGFWVLFDDKDIKALAQEQARISKYRMIATVHNAGNAQFKSYFEQRALTDKLYDIRFFYKEEMYEMMRANCKKVTIVPVGKGKKNGEDWLIAKGFSNPFLLRFYLRSQTNNAFKSSERLLCIGEL